MEKRRSIIVLSSLLVLALNQSALAQSGSYNSSELNKFADIIRPDKETLGIMVTGAEYATGWNPTVNYFYPRFEEKLLVIHFVVKNRNSRETRVGNFSTNFTAISRTSKEFPQDNRKELRLAGTTEKFDASLKPGQSQAFYTAITVDGNAQIEGLRIDPQFADENATGVELKVSGSVAELPPQITDNGVYKNDFKGEFNQTYRLSTADFTLSQFYTIGKLPAVPNATEDNWGIAQLNIRNLHSATRRVFYDSFKPTRALTNTGRLVQATYLVTPDLQDRIDVKTELYESVQGALAFPLEPGETIIEVFIGERPARAADGEETSIQIHYTLDSDKNPLDRFTDNAIAQRISGVNRRPAFEGQTVPPGVYDPVRSWADFFADNGSIPADALNNTGPKDLNGMVLTPFFTPPPTVVNRPEDKTPPANQPPPKDNPTPPNLNLALRLKDLKITLAQEISGDEPWLAIMAFRGIPGRPETASSIFIPSTQCKTVGSDMGSGDTVNLSTQLGLREFRDVKPFEVIGLYVICAEVDGGSASDRDASALRMAGKLFTEWKATLSRANPASLNDYSIANVRRQAQNLNVIFQNFLSPLSFNQEFSAKGTVDDDDYAGRSGAVWMYLPGLTDSQAIAISKLPTVGAGLNYRPDGYIPRGDWKLDLWHNQGTSSTIYWNFRLSLYAITP